MLAWPLTEQRSMRLFGTNGSGGYSDFSVSSICAYFFQSEGQGFILVYSIASRATFDRLEVFRQSMLRVKRQRPLFILVGNKCDKTYEREVTKDEGIALARSFGCSFMETSAKTAHNIELVFTNLVRALRTTQQMAGGMPNPRNPLEEKKQRKCVILWQTFVGHTFLSSAINISQKQLRAFGVQAI